MSFFLLLLLLLYLLKMSCLYTDRQAKTEDKIQGKLVKNARNETSQCLSFYTWLVS